MCGDEYVEMFCGDWSLLVLLYVIVVIVVDFVGCLLGCPVSHFLWFAISNLQQTNLTSFLAFLGE